MGTPSPPNPAGAPAPLLVVQDLVKHFPIRKGLVSRTVGAVRAVDGVSFSIQPAETYALVGESGCGKTTTGRSLLRLIEPTSGQVRFDGEDVLALPPAALRSFRRRMQIIFQDPYASLNPRMTVQDTIADGLVIHGIGTPAEQAQRVLHLLERVGLQPDYANRYPHEFSGGQRQRLGIARALALEPSFIVCDEAVSALDVSVQAQVINLLQDLQQDFGLAYLFIAHDLAVVRHIANRIGVMYLGLLMEEAPCDELFDNPLHPYTQALLSAIPVPDPQRKRHRILLQGDVPNPVAPPSGCRFHPRCPQAREACRAGTIPVSEPCPGHRVKCVLYG